MPFASLIRLTASAIVLAMLPVASLRADVILDNFSTPGTASTASFTSTGTTTIDTSSVLGGTRTTTADVNSVAGVPGGISIGAGSFSFSTGTGGVASTTISYTGLNGGAGLDLSSYSDLSLLFSAIGSSSSPMPFSVALNGVTGASPTGIDINPGSVTALIPLTAANFSGVNFSSINSITLTFNDPNPTTGFTLNNLSAVPTPSVPEPGSLFLWGLIGMVGLCFSYRNLRGRVAV